MKLVRVAGVTAVLFLATAGIYVFVLGGSGGAAVEDVTVDVTLNDESLEEAIEGESRSCIGVGPLPGHFIVTVQATIYDEWSGRYVSQSSYEFVVQMNGETRSRNITVIDSGPEEVNEFVTIEDDGSISPGENATVKVSLQKGGNVIDSVEKTVTVKEQDMTCVDGGLSP